MERVEFYLAPSRYFELWIWSNTIAGIAILCWLPLFFLIKGIGMVLLCRYALGVRELHAKKRSKDAVVFIWQDPQGRWGCQTRNNRFVIGELSGDSFKGLCFHIVRVRLKRRILSVIVPRDALLADEFRCLSTRLQLG